MSYKQTVTIYRVAERLPDVGCECMVWAGHRWDRAYMDEDGHFILEGTTVRLDATHWHEIPGPPRVPCPPCGGIGTREVIVGQACPSEHCPMCSGEACALCGAGCSAGRLESMCTHDVDERHTSTCSACKGEGYTPIGSKS